MLLLWMSLLLNATTPFEDVQRRFTIELPAGWRFAPMPGDIEGATFKKEADGLGANASVRVFAMNREVTLASVADDTRTVVAREPAFRMLSEEGRTLAGLPGVRRRYVHGLGDGSKRLKMVEDRMAVYGQTVYLVRTEALAEAFTSFEDELEVLFSTFRPLGINTPSDPTRLTVGPLVGRWALESDPSTVFELRSDGSFDLAGTGGSFRLLGSRLITVARGGVQEEFGWQVRGDTLTLSSPAFSEPLSYVRIQNKAGTPGRKGKATVRGGEPRGAKASRPARQP